MENRLFHIHLHDNDRTGDYHGSIGHGTIDFEPFYDAIVKHVPQVTISLEVEDKMEVKMGDLRELAAHFASKRISPGVSSWKTKDFFGFGSLAKGNRLCNLQDKPLQRIRSSDFWLSSEQLSA
jgi:hypothetical protein